MDRYDVIITEPAEHDIVQIFYYISAKLLAPETATDMLDTFDKEIQSLELMPKRNPLIHDAFFSSLGYRIMPVKNYMVFYSVYDLPEPEVYIERILYNRRDWQNIVAPTQGV